MSALPRTVAASALALSLVLASTGCSSSDGSDGTATTTTAAAEVTTPTVDLETVTFEDMTGQAAVTIDAVDNNFEPQYIEISPGTAVTFKNDGRNSHNVVPVGDSGIQEIPTDEFEPGTETKVTLDSKATFDEPGDYRYYCTLHGTTNKGMVGAIRVTATR